MEKPSAAFHELALLLLRHEAGGQREPAELANAVERVCQKMGRQIAILIGPTGFHAIAGRSLHLTKAEEPFLKRVEFGPATSTDKMSEQGWTCLTGLHESVQGRDPAEVGRGVAVLLAHFLWLLSDFIGEDIVLGLLRRGWLDMSLDARAPGSEEVKE